jgi:hypothetical protein
MLPKPLGDQNLESDADRLRTLLGFATLPGAVTSHSSLTGLGNDDHAQYVHLSAARVITAQHSFAPAAAQPPFTLGVNAQGQTVTGLKADQLNKSVTAGSGLTGGGALTGTVALAIDTAVVATLTGGKVPLAIGGTHADLSATGGAGQYLRQSSVGAAITVGAIAGGDLPAGIVYNTETIGVSGLGLSGGGDLSAARTITLTSSSNPGAAAAILASTAAGALTLVNFTATGFISAGSVSSSLLPTTTDTYDLGSATKLWRKGWLSELDAILFSQNTVSVIGGWLMVAHNEGLIPVGQDVGAADATIDFGQAMTNGDFVLFRANGQVEYVSITSLSAGTRYNVTRNLDGSGANAWPAGSVYVVLGQTGAGRIELNSNATPRISIFKQGATYNAGTEVVRIGDMNGWGAAVTEVYGAGFGDYPGGNYLTYDTAGGFVLKGGGGNVKIDANGLSVIQGSVSSSKIKFGSFADIFSSSVLLTIEAGLTGNGTDGQISLAANRTAGTGVAQITIDTVAGVIIQSQGASPPPGDLHVGGSTVLGASFGSPNAMLDVRGSGIVTGGLNVGTATGAATGALKISDSIRQSTALGTRAYHNAAQAVATATWTSLALNSELFDNDTIHDLVTNNSRLTCKTAGVYVITGTVSIAASAAGTLRGIRIFLNGVTPLDTVLLPLVVNTSLIINVSGIYNLALNDYVELQMYQDTGGALNALWQANVTPMFSMARIP